MKIQKSNNSNESIGYIGHGQLESSPASMSVLHVISHELDHIAEFKNEAIRDNAEIRSIDMKIDFEFRDGKLVAVSGKTTATSKIRSNEKKPNVSETNAQNEDNQKDNKNNLELKPEKEKIASEEKKLLYRIEYINSEINLLENKNYYTEPEPKNIYDKKDEQRKKELKEKKQKLEIELSNLKIKTQIENSQEMLKESLDKTQNQSLDLVQTQFTSKPGFILDLKI
ncbi:MAG: hypothetical protein L6Q54_09060 [Leptospiraceae bacterium]|nr:hypothetical protein [Leptospiraceae bacterium]MCK6381381.1 hypothetical protein [Leptospiraceae bacterium]